MGRPLVVHVWERVRSARLIDRVVVATDDDRIDAAVSAAGGEVVRTDATLRSGSDRCAQALDRLGIVDGVVINVQGDVPLVSPDDLDRLVGAFSDPTVQVATGSRPLPDADRLDRARVKVVTALDGRALYFSRAPIPSVGAARLHVGLYAFRAAALRAFAALPQTPLELAEDLEQLRMLEHGWSIHVLGLAAECPSVDTPEDLERLRATLAA